MTPIFIDLDRSRTMPGRGLTEHTLSRSGSVGHHPHSDYQIHSGAIRSNSSQHLMTSNDPRRNQGQAMRGRPPMLSRPRSVNSSFDSRRTGGGSSMQSSIDQAGYLSDRNELQMQHQGSHRMELMPNGPEFFNQRNFR